MTNENIFIFNHVEYSFNEPRTHGLQYNLKTTAACIKRNDEDVKKIFLEVKQGRPQKA